MSKTAFARSPSSILNMRSTTAVCRTYSAWWRMCWIGISGTSAPSDCGAASLEQPRRSISDPTPWLSVTALWAEMTCFLQLGWRFPVHVYDLHTAYLSVSNILLPYDPDEVRKKPRKNLAAACCAYGIEGWEKIDKPGIAKAIGEGRWREYGQPAVFDYCEEDVRNSAELLRRQLLGYRNYAPIDPQRVMYWSEYSAKTVARIQAKRHANRHAAVEPDPGEQDGGDPRADRAI